MKRLSLMALVVGLFTLGLLALGCGGKDGAPDSGQPAADSGVADSGVPDAGQPDAGPYAGGPDGGHPDAGLPDGGQPQAGALSISGYTFSPAELTVDPGSVITVTNSDGFSHTVTSEAADNAFTPGAVNGVSFDTGFLAGGASIQLTIPANAPSGTVIPFFCQSHTTMMNPANGHVTVR